MENSSNNDEQLSMPNTASEHDTSHDQFLQRVGKMPLFSGVVRAYERGKGTSKVVRYGADLVESSVNSLSGRVASKVGPERIAQIDRYAGAALDRLGQFSRSQSPPSVYQHDCLECDRELAGHSKGQGAYPADAQQHDHHYLSPQPHKFAQLDSDPHQYLLSFKNDSQHHLSEPNSPNPASPPHGRLLEVSRNNKSRWQNMLVEAGVTAGGIGAAVSEESMKSLQYCLQWLHYATVHLDHQITVLRDFISSLNVPHESCNVLISARAVSTLANIKMDVVETIRKVVDVVSKYAGGALPEPAKQFVRTSILGLPLRWAEAIQADPLAGPSSASSLPSPAPCLASRHSQTKAATELAADRVLTFAVESLDMLKSITAIFSESVERADAWVERLRLIGIQHRHRQAQDANQAVRGGAELSSCDTEGEQDGVRAMAGGRSRGVKTNRVEPEGISQRTGISSSDKSEWRWPSQGGVVRSRSSSTSTMGDSTSMSDSMMSGWERSTAGSLNTSMTTLGSTGSNVVVGEQGGRERGMTAKRRKANVRTGVLSTPWTGTVGSVVAPEAPACLGQEADRAPFRASDPPLLSALSLPPRSSSLHKLLLDHHQVSAFDLVHRWARDDALPPPLSPATLRPASPTPTISPLSPSFPDHFWLDT